MVHVHVHVQLYVVYLTSQRVLSKFVCVIGLLNCDIIKIPLDFFMLWKKMPVLKKSLMKVRIVQLTLLNVYRAKLSMLP